METNALKQLNTELFKELQRINNDDLKGQDLINEVERAKAVAMVASQVVMAVNAELKAQMMPKLGVTSPTMLEYRNE